MLKVLVIGVAVLVAGPAWAGCANYVDGSLAEPAPAAETCFRGECETTTVDVTCGNATGHFIAFANGWRLDQFLEEGEHRLIVTRHDKVVDEDLDTIVLDGDKISDLVR